MKLVQINVVCNGSTGKIMCDIAKIAKNDDIKTYCFYGRGKGKDDVCCIKVGNILSTYFHAVLARLGFNGHGSYFATRNLVRHLKKINPDVIHLHNIHGYYLNIKVLFKYLKNDYKGKIIWTLHDCWPFTGHCSYFTVSKCKKWKKMCHNCPNLNIYPRQFFDTTRKEYTLKKRLFLGLDNLIFVTPSDWLKKIVKSSFLQKYDVRVINNGIDLNVFKSTYDEGIYSKYSLPKDKKIVLGVANVWEDRKGLKDFIELSKIVDDDVQIVLIGIDSKLSKTLPNNIIAIERTENQIDLAKLYTISTVFFNPTYEDNYPTTNLESIACGTPIVCYNTGGCKEQIFNDNFGFIIKKGDYKRLIEIINSNEIKAINDKDVLALGVDNMKNKYISLYQSLYKEG